MRSTPVHLPLYHLLIDLALLLATAYAVDTYRSNLRDPWPLWQQQYQRIDRDFLKSADGPPMEAPLQAMNFGTLPATIGTDLLAAAVFANGSLSWRASSPFDARMVTIHLCLAFGFWYATARVLKAHRHRWTKLATAYVAARALTLPLSLICEPSGATWQLLALAFHSAWALSLTLALAAWLRIRSNRPPATPA